MSVAAEVLTTVCKLSIRASFPAQKVFAAVPNDPVDIVPPVVVISGKLAADPSLPSLVMLPCVCEAGVRASLNRASFPAQKVFAVVPKDPVDIVPPVVVISGKLAADPSLPSLVMLP